MVKKFLKWLFLPEKVKCRHVLRRNDVVLERLRYWAPFENSIFFVPVHNYRCGLNENAAELNKATAKVQELLMKRVDLYEALEADSQADQYDHNGVSRVFIENRKDLEKLPPDVPKQPDTWRSLISPQLLKKLKILGSREEDALEHGKPKPTNESQKATVTGGKTHRTIVRKEPSSEDLQKFGINSSSQVNEEASSTFDVEEEKKKQAEKGKSNQNQSKKQRHQQNNQNRGDSAGLSTDRIDT